jgi:hypothetical protein
VADGAREAAHGADRDAHQCEEGGPGNVSAASEARGVRRRGRKPHLLASGPAAKTRRGRPRPAGAIARPPQSRTVRPAGSRTRQSQRACLRRRRDLTIPAPARRDAQGSTGSGQGRLRCGRFGGISAPPSCSYASCPLRGWCAPRCYLRPGAADQGGCTGGMPRHARPAQDGCAGAQCREITNGIAPEPFRWTAEALLAMQEVSLSADEALLAAC